jgi:hypothetical protein
MGTVPIITGMRLIDGKQTWDERRPAYADAPAAWIADR